MNKRVVLFLLMTFCVSAAAQSLEDNIQLDNRTYVPDIESVTLLPTGQIMGAPVIKLGTDNSLTLTFDDLKEVSRYYKYTFIHCTNDWKLSDLNPIEYIDGFMEDEIATYHYSFNTTVHYVQYSVTFPNENIKPYISGNYILLVYDDTPDRPILTRRFMVLESEDVPVSGHVHTPSDVSERFDRQEIDFKILSGGYVIRNPAVTLRATILQNGRWDNAIYGLTYRNAYGSEISFDYDDGRNVMDGGAEFRTFDISTLHSNADHVIGINFDHHINQAYLLQDEAMPYGAYESRSTINGACYYFNRDFDHDYSEDYVNTHFTLHSTFPFSGGDVYVFGQLTDWQIREAAKLTYNVEYDYWEAALFLKQGKYNYQYVYVPHDRSRVDSGFIEGNHYQTGNQYTVLVYYREESGTYDRLIGIGFFGIQ